MTVENIRLQGFRNYSETGAEFSGEVNVIAGKNAQGKTNLMEALYYLSTGRSFRARSDRDLVGFDREAAELYAEVLTHGRKTTLEAKIIKGRRKEFFSGGARLKTAAELSGKLAAVLFCPDDLGMIRDGAAVRRRLVNQCLAQLRPRYAAALSEFGRLYEHKTRILRDWREKPSLLDTLDDFSRQLSEASAVLIHYRAQMALRLSEKAALIHREFSGGVEKLGISYKTIGAIENPLAKPSELLPYILEHQRARRQAEIDSGSCLVGAHKDDLEITIDGAAARSFASQGQSRTAALSIKLAERDIMYDDIGEYPVLLLDDVLSELDGQRQNFVLNRIRGGQVFITCCEDEGIAGKTGGRILKIDGGVIS